MRKSILVTTDFVVSSRNAIELALDFSRRMDCDLIFLHSYRLTNRGGQDLVAWKRKIEEEALDKFSLIEDDLLKNSGIKYALKIEVGFLADRVEEAIRKNEIVFLVTDKLMYNQSRSSFDELVENTDVPIIIAPLTKTSASNPSTSVFRSSDA